MLNIDYRFVGIGSLTTSISTALAVAAKNHIVRQYLPGVAMALSGIAPWMILVTLIGLFLVCFGVLHRPVISVVVALFLAGILYILFYA